MATSLLLVRFTSSASGSLSCGAIKKRVTCIRLNTQGQEAHIRIYGKERGHVRHQSRDRLTSILNDLMATCFPPPMT